MAIKFLTEALEADPTARERLHREARSAAALDHPYICQIHELADIDGRTGIVMEHVSGETVRARLRRAPLAANEALGIAAEIAEAVDATSFILMAAKGIRLAFTFDHHVASTGFRLVG